MQWLTPEKLLLDRRHLRHLEKEQLRTWWEYLSAFTRIIAAGQLSPVTELNFEARLECHFL